MRSEWCERNPARCAKNFAKIAERTIGSGNFSAWSVTCDIHWRPGGDFGAVPPLSGNYGACAPLLLLVHENSIVRRKPCGLTKRLSGGPHER
jgi:hypothetical protein